MSVPELNQDETKLYLAYLFLYKIYILLFNSFRATEAANN